MQPTDKLVICRYLLADNWLLCRLHAKCTISNGNINRPIPMHSLHFWASRWFLLFYSSKPPSQVWTLISRKWSIQVSYDVDFLKARFRFRLVRWWLTSRAFSRERTSRLWRSRSRLVKSTCDGVFVAIFFKTIYIIKQLLHSVFVISWIIKVSVRVISPSLRLG